MERTINLMPSCHPNEWKGYSQWTWSKSFSSRETWCPLLPMMGLDARHEMTTPLSLGLGIMERLEILTFPSEDTVWRITMCWLLKDDRSVPSDPVSLTPMTGDDPLNHVIRAGGLDPLERHTSSDRIPADNTLFGEMMVTSRGLTEYADRKRKKNRHLMKMTYRGVGTMFWPMGHRLWHSLSRSRFNLDRL